MIVTCSNTPTWKTTLQLLTGKYTCITWLLFIKRFNKYNYYYYNFIIYFLNKRCTTSDNQSNPFWSWHVRCFQTSSAIKQLGLSYVIIKYQYFPHHFHLNHLDWKVINKFKQLNKNNKSYFINHLSLIILLLLAEVHFKNERAWWVTNALLTKLVVWVVTPNKHLRCIITL